jgi:hypothetical protein
MSTLTTQPASLVLPADEALDRETDVMSADTLPEIDLPDVVDASPVVQTSCVPVPVENEGGQNSLAMGLLMQLGVLLALLIWVKEGVVLAIAIEHVLLAVVGAALFVARLRRVGLTLLVIGTFPMITVLPFLVCVACKFQ